MRLNYLIPSNILNKELEYKRKCFLGHWCSTYSQQKKDFIKGDVIQHRWRIRKNFVKDYNNILQNLSVSYNLKERDFFHSLKSCLCLYLVQLNER